MYHPTSLPSISPGLFGPRQNVRGLFIQTSNSLNTHAPRFRQEAISDSLVGLVMLMLMIYGGVSKVIPRDNIEEVSRELVVRVRPRS